MRNRRDEKYDEFSDWSIPVIIPEEFISSTTLPFF